MTKVIVIGAGSAGIAAAVGARKAGAKEVVLLERQDQLLGIGRIAGSMDVGGRYPLHLEILEMGAPEVNEVLDEVTLPNTENYRNSHYPWHSLPGSEEMTKHSWVYNVLTAEPALRKLKAQEPGRKIILHAPAVYEALHHLIGFDGFEANETDQCDGPGIDLHWTLERHPGWYSLDRVSMWEDILGVPIGSEPVVLDVPKEQSALRNAPAYAKPILAFLPFSSGAGLIGRSLPGKQIVALIEALSEEYGVVMPHHAQLPELAKRTRATCFEGLRIPQFMATVADCDRCLSVDSGGLYVAAAAGVPSVGLYDHVPPWLRAKRFPNIYSLDLRRPTCACLQHDACTCPEKGQRPCGFFDPDIAVHALACCDPYGGRILGVYPEEHVHPPRIGVRIDGRKDQWCDGDARATEFILKHALAGIEWGYWTEDVRHDVALTVKAGDLISREDALRSMSLVMEPGFKNLNLPLDMKKHPGPEAGTKS